MADTSLTSKQDDQSVAASTQEISSEEAKDQDILTMIEEAKREAEERAFRRAQSKIDQDIARERQTWQAQYGNLLGRYRQALAWLTTGPSLRPWRGWIEKHGRRWSYRN